MKRVKLVKEITPELPEGSIGEVMEGDPEAPGMTLVRWFGWMILPMYNNEIEAIPENEQGRFKWQQNKKWINGGKEGLQK